MARLVLYSGTAKFSNSPVNLEPIFESMKMENISKSIREVSVRSKFKVQATLTREYGKKFSGPNTKYDALTFKLIWKDKAHAVTMFSSGNLTFTGGYPDGETDIRKTPRIILKRVVGKIPFQLRGVTIQIEGKYSVNRLQNIQGELGGDIKKDRFLLFDLAPFKLRMYATGVVQVSGITQQSQVGIAERQVRDLLGTLRAAGVIANSNRVAAPHPTRPQRRGANEIAPEIVSRATTCPPDKRPVPYSFGGQAPPGYYVAPNPQGQPCCYKIPRRIEYKKNKVVNRFRRLGIQIPQVTKNAFKIVENNRNKPVNVAPNANFNMIFTNSNQGFQTGAIDEFKIGSRQAKRYAMPRLVDIARRIGVGMNIRGKNTKGSKDKLIVSIRNWARARGKVLREGQPIVNTTTNVRNSSRGILRLGPRGRVASSYTKPQLVAVAATLQPPLFLNEAMTMKEMLDALRVHVA